MPKVAISYRRSDSTIASRIFRRLVDRYGKESVFIDVNDVPAGAAFPQYVDTILSKNQIVLCLNRPHPMCDIAPSCDAWGHCRRWNDRLDRHSLWPADHAFRYARMAGK